MVDGQRFTSISAGGAHSCGLTESHAAVCWGSDIDGRSSAPRMAFTQISAGGTASCGLAGAQLVCWGTGSSPMPNVAARRSAVAAPRSAVRRQRERDE
jgi:hypothetical protein